MTIEEENRRLKEIYDMPYSDEKFQKLICLADDGSVSAQKIVAKGLIDADKDKALHYYRLAAEGGDKDSQFNVFSILTEDSNYRLNESSEAFRYLVKSANQRYEPAVIFLASVYIGSPLGNSTKAKVEIPSNPRKSIEYVKKLDGKTEHTDIQEMIDIIKRYISSHYPSVYNEYYGSAQINSNYQQSGVDRGIESARSSGCFRALLIFLAFFIPVIGLGFGIEARKRGSGVAATIAIGYNVIIIALFILYFITQSL